MSNWQHKNDLEKHFVNIFAKCKSFMYEIQITNFNATASYS